MLLTLAKSSKVFNAFMEINFYGNLKFLVRRKQIRRIHLIIERCVVLVITRSKYFVF